MTISPSTGDLGTTIGLKDIRKNFSSTNVIQKVDHGIDGDDFVVLARLMGHADQRISDGANLGRP